MGRKERKEGEKTAKARVAEYFAVVGTKPGGYGGGGSRQSSL